MRHARAWMDDYITAERRGRESLRRFLLDLDAEQPELFAILGPTPYSLRRGGISLRLRAEDPQTVASECGTSLRTLSTPYAYAIEDLRRNGPRPADTEWRAARAEQAERQAPGSPLSAYVIGNAAHPRGKIRNWLDTHKRRRRGV